MSQRFHKIKNKKKKSFDNLRNMAWEKLHSNWQYGEVEWDIYYKTTGQNDQGEKEVESLAKYIAVSVPLDFLIKYF